MQVTNIALRVALVILIGALLTASVSFQNAAAQISTNTANTTTTTTTTTGNISAVSLGNPFFIEKGKVIGQRVITVTP